MVTDKTHWTERWSRALIGLSKSAMGRQLLVVIPIVLAITYFYAFLASAGTFRMIPGRPDYYDRMCEGFRAGHLYILEQPNPQLLAKPNPYADENFFQNLWLWDASLYKGRYYLYWGPVPALLLWLWKVLTGYVGTVSDQWATVCYMTGRLVFGTGLILGLAKYMKSRPPTWLVALCVAVFGLTSPMPFIVARPDIYEASLASGQCFLFGGWWFAFLGLVQERRRAWWFVLSSTACALAFGSRATTAIASPFILGATLFFLWYKVDRSFSKCFRSALALGVPFGLGCLGMGIYNYLRFDSPFEFGVHLQVTLQRFTRHDIYIIPNLYSYLFAPLKWSCAFPFVAGQKFRPLSKLITWPAGYLTFEVAGGVLVMGGFLWLQFTHVYWGARALVRRFAPWLMQPVMRVSWIHLWAIVCAIGAILSLWPALGLWESSMRYSGDAVGGMGILATIGAFWLVRRGDESTWLRWWSRALVVLLGLHSCLVGGLVGMTSYDEPFRHYNPALLGKLVEMFSLCHWF
jgi:hypothetical protein